LLHLHRQPDLEFDGSLGQSGDSGHLCDCRIWLPKDASEDAWIDISVPMSPKAPVYLGPGPLTLLGRMGGSSDVTVTGIWIKEGPSQYWPPREAASTKIVVSHIEKIIQRYCFETSNQSADDEVAEPLVFGLTDCKFLHPALTIESSYTGDVKVSVVAQATLAYPALGDITFERYYTNYKRDDVNGTVYTSSLVAVVNNPRLARLNIESVESEVEDVCLLASLAARHRVLVNDLRYANKNELYQSWSTPLKRHRPSPQGAFGKGLIERKDLEEYFGTAAERFCSYAMADKQRIREAIYPLVPAFPLGGVEPEYLGLFSSLEGLIRLGKLDSDEAPTVVDKDRWKKAKREIKNAINALDADFSDSDRDSFRQKLGELNRPSLQSSLTAFVSKHGISVSDLWPIFGSSEMPGLYEIRNYLAHGDRPPGESLGALGIARSHLSLLLERCLLSSLGFSIERSRATASNLHVETVAGKAEIEGLQQLLAKRRPEG
jgi:hypothetical protein